MIKEMKLPKQNGNLNLGLEVGFNKLGKVGSFCYEMVYDTEWKWCCIVE